MSAGDVPLFESAISSPTLSSLSQYIDHLTKRLTMADILKLQTSSHRLTLYPSSNTSPAYYSLADKLHPEQATPQKLEPEHQLELQQKDTQQNELAVLFQGLQIGEFDGSDDKSAIKLADFVSSWRDELSRTDQEYGELGNDGVTEKTVHRKINSLLQEQIQDFTYEDTFSARMVTWNLHGEPVYNQQLNLLLGLPVMKDMYVLALQETDTLGPKNLYANTHTLENAKDTLLGALGDDYEIVGSNQLLGLMLLVATTKRLGQQISDIRRDTTGTGLFGVWGNKGAAVIWLRVGADASDPQNTGTELVFVNCHLSAGDGQSLNDRRKWEFSEIAKKLKIDGLVSNAEEKLWDSQDAEELKVDSIAKEVEQKHSADKTLTFLMGDLNYRVTMDRDMVKEFSDRKDYDTIVVQDQLRHSIKDDKLLQGFAEGEISFPPSYKYVPGTDNFDDHERTPSYTDRIFYTKGDSRLVQTEYTSCSDYTVSDHKPVVSSFELTLNHIDFDKRKKIVDNALRDWDYAENLSRAMVEIEPREVNVKNCTIFQQTEAWLKLVHSKDSMSGVLHWDLGLCDEAGGTSCPLISNIRVEPTEGDLPCGAGQDICIRFTPTVAEPTLTKIAIVKFTDGQDLFLPIEFKCGEHCFGKSLNTLSHEGVDNIPKQIHYSIDYLWDKIIPEMFVKQSDPNLQLQIQAWFNQEQSFDHAVLEKADEVSPNISIYSVAQALLLLLRHLQDGVIPSTIYNDVMKRTEKESKSAVINTLLDVLPKVNANTLIHICGFLHKVIEQQSNEKQILEIFEPLLIFGDSQSKHFLNMDKKRRRDLIKSLVYAYKSSSDDETEQDKAQRGGRPKVVPSPELDSISSCSGKSD